MCSLSWHREQGGLVVRFNRDEQRSRPPGNPPVPSAIFGVPVLAPSDPLGGGTWLALNGFGVVLALLNHHAAHSPAAPTSRGAIIPSLAMVSSADEAMRRLAAQRLADYRPFQLAALERSGQVRALRWDGVGLAEVDVSAGMLSSSSHEPGRVLEARLKTWREMSPTPGGPERFHSWRCPEDGAASVLMERPDARTVSRSRITLGNGTATFHHEDLDDSGLVTDFSVHHLGLTET